jgi:hypothetical protein
MIINNRRLSSLKINFCNAYIFLCILPILKKKKKKIYLNPLFHNNMIVQLKFDK